MAKEPVFIETSIDVGPPPDGYDILDIPTRRNGAVDYDRITFKAPDGSTVTMAEMKALGYYPEEPDEE